MVSKTRSAVDSLAGSRHLTVGLFVGGYLSRNF